MPTPLLLAALLFPLQTAKAEATPWETVVSEDGQYSVEMPATPNFRATKSRTSPDGQVRMNIRGCRAAGGSYFVQKSEFATNLITGTEDTQLDAERDEFARQYGGTPTGEKKVTLGGAIPGREFTIRGKPKGELGIITVRVREYLVGKKIYAVLVTSMANRELPDDTDRFLGSLKLLSGSRSQARPRRPARAQAATPAADRGFPERERAWRTWPRGMGYAGRSGRRLQDPSRGKYPGHRPAETAPLPDPILPLAQRAPRLPSNRGDFEVQVKVAGTFKPIGPSETSHDDTPSNGAGLILFGEGEQLHHPGSAGVPSQRHTHEHRRELQRRAESRGQGNRTPKFGSRRDLPPPGPKGENHRGQRQQ